MAKRMTAEQLNHMISDIGICADNPELVDVVSEALTLMRERDEARSDVEAVLSRPGAREYEELDARWQVVWKERDDFRRERDEWRKNHFAAWKERDEARDERDAARRALRELVDWVEGNSEKYTLRRAAPFLNRSREVLGDE